MAEKRLSVKAGDALDNDADGDAIDGPRTWLGKLCLLYSLKAFDFTTRLAGPVLFSLVWLLVGIVVYAYFKHYCPLIKMDPLFSSSGILRTLVVAYFTISVLYHHVQCATTSPGFAVLEDNVGISGQRFHRSYPGFCRFCRSTRPSRSHHCHICKRCVLKMDHHCPWVANCVGQGNYHHFLLLIVNAFIASIILIANTIPLLLSSPTRGDRGSEGGTEEDQVAMIIVITVLFTSAAVALGALVSLHIYLLLTNQTTRELWKRFSRRRKRKIGVPFTDKTDERQDSISNSLGVVKNVRSVFHHHRNLLWYLVPGSLSWAKKRSTISNETFPS